MTNYSRHFAGRLEITRRQFTSLVFSLVLGLGLGAPDSFAQERWVPTWGTSPASASMTISFANQTLRQFVHVSIGGSRVRVRFSNTLGTDTLFINSAHVAMRGLESAIVAGTDRARTFGGEEAAVIPTRAWAGGGPPGPRMSAPAP